jgi:hypothetical protein
VSQTSRSRSYRGEVSDPSTTKFRLAILAAQDQALRSMKSCTALFLAFVVLAAGVFCSGCVFSVGGHGGDPGQTRPATQGQELIDLKKAHDQGAMSDAEYEAAKARLLAK